MAAYGGMWMVFVAQMVFEGILPVLLIANLDPPRVDRHCSSLFEYQIICAFQQHWFLYKNSIHSCHHHPEIGQVIYKI